MDRLNATSDAEEERPSAAGTVAASGATVGDALMRVTEIDIDGVTVQGPNSKPVHSGESAIGCACPVFPQRPPRSSCNGDRSSVPSGQKGAPLLRSAGRLVPGDIALIDLDMPAGTRLESGVVVLAVRPESFTLITPDGHVFAGVITFSAFHSGGTPLAQIEIVFRSGDPIFEVGMRLSGHRRENRFWMEVLASLAKHFGVNGRPEMYAELLDRRVQWSQAKNVAHNAYLRNGFGRGVVPVVSRLRGFGTRIRPGREETADS
ncbi:MAG: hypothetical protein R2845_01300 [Thermomicrobiales bacterium]